MGDDLSHAFQGLDPQEFRLKKVMMVGAVPDPDMALGLIDLSLLRLAVFSLNFFKIPISDSLERCANDASAASLVDLDIVNILPEYGGRDFLGDTATADIVIFCHIPGTGYERDKEESHYSLYNPERLRASFTFSAQHHNIPLWRERLEQTQAQIAFVYGIDSFSPHDLKGDQFLLFQGYHCADGLLIREDYCEAMQALMYRRESILRKVLRLRHQNPALRDFRIHKYDTPGRKPGEDYNVTLHPEPY